MHIRHGMVKDESEEFIQLINKYPVQNTDWLINSNLSNYANVSLSDYLRFNTSRKINKLTTAIYKNFWVYFVRTKLKLPHDLSVKLDPWNRIFPSVNDIGVFKNDSFYETTDIFEFNAKKAVCKIYITSVEGWGIYCVDYCSQNIN